MSMPDLDSRCLVDKGGGPLASARTADTTPGPGPARAFVLSLRGIYLAVEVDCFLLVAATQHELRPPK